MQTARFFTGCSQSQLLSQVESISLSRMIIGTNWMAGFSHRSPAADKMIVERHSQTDSIVEMLETFLAHGVDTMMAPFLSQPVIIRAVKEAQEKTGKKIILVETPIINVDDNPAARKEAQQPEQQSERIRKMRRCSVPSSHFTAAEISGK